MICRCGRLHPAATIRQKGLCVECGRSIWLQAAEKLYPDSEAIAARLNRERSAYCLCERNVKRHLLGWAMDTPDIFEKLGLFAHYSKEGPRKTHCLSICGVELRWGVWIPISAARRKEWFECGIERQWGKHLIAANLGAR